MKLITMRQIRCCVLLCCMMINAQGSEQVNDYFIALGLPDKIEQTQMMMQEFVDTVLNEAVTEQRLAVADIDATRQQLQALVTESLNWQNMKIALVPMIEAQYSKKELKATVDFLNSKQGVFILGNIAQTLEHVSAIQQQKMALLHQALQPYLIKKMPEIKPLEAVLNEKSSAE